MHLILFRKGYTTNAQNLLLHVSAIRGVPTSKRFRCGAYNWPFRKHYFNHCEESLMMAHMECRNM